MLEKFSEVIVRHDMSTSSLVHQWKFLERLYKAHFSSLKRKMMQLVVLQDFIMKYDETEELETFLKPDSLVLTFNFASLLVAGNVSVELKRLEIIANYKKSLDQMNLAFNDFSKRVFELSGHGDVSTIDVYLENAYLLYGELIEFRTNVALHCTEIAYIGQKCEIDTQTDLLIRLVTKQFQLFYLCQQINSFIAPILQVRCQSLDVWSLISKIDKIILKLDQLFRFLKNISGAHYLIDFNKERLLVISKGLQVIAVLSNEDKTRDNDAILMTLIKVDVQTLMNFEFRRMLSYSIRSKLSDITRMLGKDLSRLNDEALRRTLQQYWNSNGEFQQLDDRCKLAQIIGRIYASQKLIDIKTLSGGHFQQERTKELYERLKGFKVIVPKFARYAKEYSNLGRLTDEMFPQDLTVMHRSYPNEISAAKISEIIQLANPFDNDFSVQKYSEKLDTAYEPTSVAKKKIDNWILRAANESKRLFLAPLKDIRHLVTSYGLNVHSLKTIMLYSYPDIADLTLLSNEHIASFENTEHQKIQLFCNKLEIRVEYQSTRALARAFNSIGSSIRSSLKSYIRSMFLLITKMSKSENLLEDWQWCTSQIAQISLAAFVTSKLQKTNEIFDKVPQIMSELNIIQRVLCDQSESYYNEHFASFVKNEILMWKQILNQFVTGETSFDVVIESIVRVHFDHHEIYISLNHVKFEFNGDVNVPPVCVLDIEDFQHKMRAIMKTLKQREGCALYGKVGTGKTRLLKYIASLLGYTLLEYDCINYIKMFPLAKMLENVFRIDMWIVIRNIEQAPEAIVHRICQLILLLRHNSRSKVFVTCNTEMNGIINRSKIGAILPEIHLSKTESKSDCRSSNNFDVEQNTIDLRPDLTINDDQHELGPSIVLNNILNNECEQRHYREYESLVKACVNVYNALLSGDNVILVGEAGTGKTTCLNLLSTCISRIVDKNIDKRLIRFFKIYAEQFDYEDLVGSTELDNLLESSNSKLFKFIKLVNEKRLEDIVVPVIDCDLHNAQNSEKLFELLLMRRFMDHEGNDIGMRQKLNFIFEVDSLRFLTPQQATRCVLIQFDQSALRIDVKYKNWIASISQRLPLGSADILEFLCNRIMLPCNEFMEHRSDGLPSVCKFRTFSKIFEGFVTDFEQMKRSSNSQSSSIQSHLVFGWFYFSLFWSFGYSTSDTNSFDVFIRNLIAKVGDESHEFNEVFKKFSNFPPQETVHGIFLGQQGAGADGSDLELWSKWPVNLGDYFSDPSVSVIETRIFNGGRAANALELMRLLVLSNTSFIAFDCFTLEELQLTLQAILMNSRTRSSDIIYLDSKRADFRRYLDAVVGMRFIQKLSSNLLSKAIVVDNISESTEFGALEKIRNVLDIDVSRNSYSKDYLFCCNATTNLNGKKFSEVNKRFCNTASNEESKEVHTFILDKTRINVVEDIRLLRDNLQNNIEKYNKTDKNKIHYILTENTIYAINQLVNLLKHPQSNGIIVSGCVGGQYFDGFRLACYVAGVNAVELIDTKDCLRRIFEHCRVSASTKSTILLFCKFNKNTRFAFKELLINLLTKGTNREFLDANFSKELNDPKLMLKSLYLRTRETTTHWLEDFILLNNFVFKNIKICIILDCFEINNIFQEFPTYRCLERVDFDDWKKDEVELYIKTSLASHQWQMDQSYIEFIAGCIETVVDRGGSKPVSKYIRDILECTKALFDPLIYNTFETVEKVIIDRLKWMKQTLNEAKQKMESLIQTTRVNFERIGHSRSEIEDLVKSRIQVEKEMLALSNEIDDIYSDLEVISKKISEEEVLISDCQTKFLQLRELINISELIKRFEEGKYQVEDLRISILCEFFDIFISSKYKQGRKINYVAAFKDYLTNTALEYMLKEFWEAEMSLEKLNYFSVKIEEANLLINDVAEASPLQILFNWLVLLIEHKNRIVKKSSLQRRQQEYLKKICEPNLQKLHDNRVYSMILTDIDNHERYIAHLEKIEQNSTKKMSELKDILDNYSNAMDILEEYKQIRDRFAIGNLKEEMLKCIFCGLLNGLLANFDESEREKFINKWKKDAYELFQINFDFIDFIRNQSGNSAIGLIAHPRQCQDMFIIQHASVSVVFDCERLYVDLIKQVFPDASVQRLCFIPTKEQFNASIKDEIVCLEIESTQMANDVLHELKDLDPFNLSSSQKDTQIKKIILLVEDSPHNLDVCFAQSYTMINVTTSPSNIASCLEDCTIKTLNSDLLKERNNTVRDIINFNRELRMEIEEMDQLISEYSDEKFPTFLQEKFAYLCQLESKSNIAIQYLGKINKSITSYAPFTDFILASLSCLDEFKTQYPCLKLRINDHLLPLHKAVLRMKNNARCQQDSILRNHQLMLCLRMFEFYGEQMKLHHQIRFGLILMKTVLDFNHVSENCGLYLNYILDGKAIETEEAVKMVENIPSNIQIELWKVATLPGLKPIVNAILKNPDDWTSVIEANEPAYCELPGMYKEINVLQKLCILRAIQPDTIHQSIEKCIRDFFKTKSIDNLRLNDVENSALEIIIQETDRSVLRDPLFKTLSGENILVLHVGANGEYENICTNLLEVPFGAELWYFGGKVGTGDRQKKLKIILERNDFKTLLYAIEYALENHCQLGFIGFSNNAQIYMMTESLNQFIFTKNFPKWFKIKLFTNEQNLSPFIPVNRVIVKYEHFSIDEECIMHFLERNGLFKRIVLKPCNDLSKFALVSFFMNVELCRRILHCDFFKVYGSIDQYLMWIECIDCNNFKDMIVELIRNTNTRVILQSQQRPNSYVLESILKNIQRTISDLSMSNIRPGTSSLSGLQYYRENRKHIKLFIPLKIRNEVKKYQRELTLGNSKPEAEQPSRSAEKSFSTLVDKSDILTTIMALLQKLKNTIPPSLQITFNDVEKRPTRSVFVDECELLLRIIFGCIKETEDVIFKLKGKYKINKSAKALIHDVKNDRVPHKWLNNLKMSHETSISEFCEDIEKRISYLRYSLSARGIYMLNLQRIIRPQLFLSQLKSSNYQLTFCFRTQLENLNAKLHWKVDTVAQMFKQTESELMLYASEILQDALPNKDKETVDLITTAKECITEIGTDTMDAIAIDWVDISNADKSEVDYILSRVQQGK
ncbi:hypothetical protein ACOME3_004891 [Neoechinorhynchus agilis]